jgi:hypothetical protein
MATIDELRSLYEAMPSERLREIAADGEGAFRPEAWQVIQEQISQRREAGRWPWSVDPAPVGSAIGEGSAADQDSLTGTRRRRVNGGEPWRPSWQARPADQPRGVGGWLIVFQLWVVLMAVGFVTGFVRGGSGISGMGVGDVLIAAAVLAVPIVGLLLIAQHRPHARPYWIAVLVGVALIAIGASLGRGAPLSAVLRAAVPSVAWALYWAGRLAFDEPSRSDKSLSVSAATRVSVSPRRSSIPAP